MVYTRTAMATIRFLYDSAAQVGLAVAHQNFWTPHCLRCHCSVSEQLGRQGCRLPGRAAGTAG